MTATIKTKHRVRLAKDFIENFDRHPITPPETEAQHENDRNHYVFIGKSSPWTNEDVPPLPLDTVVGDYRIWDEIIALKKITGEFVSHVIPRINWDATGETIYAPYDDADGELHLHPTAADIDAGNLGGFTPGPIYVMTDEFHVFKCLRNGNGSKSTEKPTLPGGAPWIIETSDGYKWKYIYSVPASLTEKFVTDNWIPVFTLEADDGSNQWLVQQDAVDGSVNSFDITDAGSLYTYIHQDKSFSANASGTVVTLQSDAIANNLQAETSFVGCSIFVTSGAEQGQVRKIASYNSGTREAELVDATDGITPSGLAGVLTGDNYDLVPSVNVSGNGTGLVAKAVIDEGTSTLESIQVQTAGQDYTYISVSLSGGLDVGGSAAIIRAKLPPAGGHGSDAVNELGGFFVMMNARLQPTLNDFPQVNDYRHIGLIRNVEKTGGGLANDDTLSGVQKLTLTGYSGGVGGDLVSDESLILDDGVDIANAKVVEFIDLGGGNATVTFWQDSTTGFVDVTNLNLAGPLTLTGAVSGATATVSSVDDREAIKNSGEILWIEHRRRITRAPDQTEDIKLVLEF
jgi:hypothetical protein